VVRRCEIDFLSPARLDDQIDIETRLQKQGKVRMTMQQDIRRSDTLLARLTVMLACVGRKGKPVGWPKALLKKIEVGKSRSREIQKT
jgi:acyl-CoA thioester hydrolase